MLPTKLENCQHVQDRCSDHYSSKYFWGVVTESTESGVEFKIQADIICKGNDSSILYVLFDRSVGFPCTTR